MNIPTLHTTDAGTRFGMLSRFPQQCAPTVFLFAMGIEETLGTDYGQTGQLLALI